MKRTKFRDDLEQLRINNNIIKKDANLILDDAFEFEGSTIRDPYFSSCGRFHFKNPEENYGQEYIDWYWKLLPEIEEDQADPEPRIPDVIHEKLDSKIQELFSDLAKQYSLKSGDISPELHEKLFVSVDDMVATISKWVIDNK